MNSNKINNNKGFNLISVIFIIFVVSIISAITVGIIITNSYKAGSKVGYTELMKDENLQEFLKVYEQILSDYYEDVDKEKMLDSAMNAMLNYLDDNYTMYMTNEEREALSERLAGSYKGIGVTISNCTIIELAESSPALKAGLQVDDTIVKVDNEDFRTTCDSDKLVSEIKNTKKKSVDITVKRGEEEKVFNVPLDEIIIKAVEGKIIEDTKIGYIYISVFSNNVGSQFKKVYDDLKNKGMTSLIIDVRNDTGGYLEGAKDIASVILEKGKLIFSLKNKETAQDFYDETEEKLDMPLVVLINGSTASSSEILAAALKDSYKNTTVIGQTSYGKGKVQQTYTLDDGSMAKYTTALWYRPNGDCIDGKGIIPDVEVVNSTTTDSEGNTVEVDDTLTKAIEYLKSQNINNLQ